MASRQKILLLDDEEQMLDVYQELLRNLPSQPEVRVSSSGSRAIALLESEPFTLLITDLNMPKMDGLQVLAIVRRKYPDLRIIVLTGVVDEEYRSRAYAQGIDLYWQKPASPDGFQLFKDCVESLLGREEPAGGVFRGMQSKSLVDIIQLECLSQSSSVLRIVNGGVEGKIWVNQGEIVDASTANFSGEDAFKEILSWKGGNFEILAAEPDRPRTIHNSYQGLLLDSAQAMDEWRSQRGGETGADGGAAGPSSPLAPLARFEGIEFVLTVPPDALAAPESWAVENASQLATWARDTHKRATALGEKIGAGELTRLSGYGLQRHWALQSDESKGLLCVGFRRGLAKESVEQTMKHVVAKWVS